MLNDFLATVRVLAVAGEWARLDRLFSIIETFLSRPQAVLTLGSPEDKPQQ